MERITEVEGLGPRAGAYVFATIFGNNVETSGQIGMDRNGDLVEGGIGPEMEQAMGNVGKILEAAGVERGDVAKARIYTTDTAPEAFRTINGIYEKFFEPGEVPARTTVGVKSLPLGALVEVEMAGYRKHCK